MDTTPLIGTQGSECQTHGILLVSHAIADSRVRFEDSSFFVRDGPASPAAGQAVRTRDLAP